MKKECVRGSAEANNLLPGAIVPPAPPIYRLFYYEECKQNERKGSELSYWGVMAWWIRLVVCSQNTSLFQNDKKFNVWIITSESTTASGNGLYIGE